LKLNACSVLADENVDPAVVAFLREYGFEVRDVKEEGLNGASDAHLLAEAYRRSEFVLTHDGDFGKLVIAEQAAFFGIVYVRPGHFNARITIDTLQSVVDAHLDVAPPFVVVAQRQGDAVRLRVRTLSSSPEGPGD
jgi:predicted nuclease of predicted toxin-antitoxin system